MSRDEAIRDMMDSMAKGKSNEVQTKFNSIMFDRASTAVNDYKQELAKSVFNNTDLKSMGLADGEERILEIDPDAEVDVNGDADENI
jgi:hypothetical protein